MPFTAVGLLLYHHLITVKLKKISRTYQISQCKTNQLKSLQEEFGHSIQFSRMPTGNAINGARWFIRQIFIYFPFEWPVVAYYKIRIMWFCLNYRSLEEMYKNFEGNKIQKPLTSHTSLLLKRDIATWFSMLKAHPLEVMALTLSMPVTIPIGIFLNLHFTIYALTMEGNNEPKDIIEYGPTDYTRTRGNHKSFFSLIMRKIVTIAQHGHMINKRPWLIKKWGHIKLRTEKEMFSTKIIESNTIPAFPDFEIYLEKIGCFAIKWATNDSDADGTIALIDKLEELSFDFSKDEEKFNASLTKKWNDTLSFFYMHGN